MKMDQFYMKVTLKKESTMGKVNYFRDDLILMMYKFKGILYYENG